LWISAWSQKSAQWWSFLGSTSEEDLAKLLKIDRSVAYKILKGTRNLTTEHIRRLCDRFSVRPDLFI
jgi:antitoxin component HigA of HigAB toxin-antitoxin module